MGRETTGEEGGERCEVRERGEREEEKGREYVFRYAGKLNRYIPYMFFTSKYAYMTCSNEAALLDNAITRQDTGQLTGEKFHL